MLKLISYWQKESYYNNQKIFKLALVVTRGDQVFGPNPGA